jgi:hypothetical protein
MIEAERNWRRVCAWIESNTPADAIFLTPADQQTFKWYSGRAEVVSWKDAPQEATGVLEWSRRLNDVYQTVPQAEFGLLGLYDHEIVALARKYSASYLVVERRFVDRRREIGYPPGFEQIYPQPERPGSTWMVFRLAPPD